LLQHILQGFGPEVNLSRESAEPVNAESFAMPQSPAHAIDPFDDFARTPSLAAAAAAAAEHIL
jgi:hypothetical protein